MKREQEPDMTPVAEAIQAVAEQGDPLEATSRLHRNVPLRAMLGAQVLIIGAEGAAVGDVSLAAVSHIPLTAASGLLVAGGYAVKRGTENRRVNRAHEIQAEARRQLGEPVDLLRTKHKRSKKPAEMTAVWHALDDPEATHDPGAIAARLNRLLHSTENTPVTQFGMAASWLKGQGVDLSGHKLVEMTYETNNAEAVIIDADPQQVVLSREATAQVVDQLETQAEVTLIDRLAAVIEDSSARTRIPGALLLGKEQAAVAAKREIVETLEGDVVPVRILLESDDKIVRYTAPGSPQVTIQGENIDTRVGYIDPQAGSDQIRADGFGSLLRLASKERLDELIADVIDTDRDYAGGEAQRALHARVALYLTLRRSLESDDDKLARLTAKDRAGSSDTSVKTFFEHFQEEPPRTVPFLRADGKVSAGTESVLEYAHRHRWLPRRIGAAVLTASIMTGAWYGGGAAAHVIYDAQIRYDNQLSDELGLKGGTGNYELFEQTRITYRKSHDTLVEELLLNANDALAQGIYDIDLATIQLAQKLGLDRLLQPFVDNYTAGSASRQSLPVGGTNLYEKNGSVETGDVPLDNNLPVYTIKSLDGRPTAGYWYSTVDNYISVDTTSSTYPYATFGLRYSQEPGTFNVDYEAVLVPGDPAKTTERPVFEVTKTSLMQNDMFASPQTHYVPVQNHTKIIAASVIEADPSAPAQPPLVPQVLRSRSTGVYVLDISPDMYKSFKQPTLRYWLAQDDDPADSIRAATHMAINTANLKSNDGPVRYTTDLLQAVMGPQERAAVVSALGLPPNASAEAIEKAIQAKQYSFTPITDRGQNYLNRADSKDITPQEFLRTVGESLADLPSLNCNLAVTAQVIATGGIDQSGAPLNVAAGWHDDGDGILSTAESHAWGLAGTELRDVTPASGPAAQVPPVSEQPKTSLEKVTDVIRYGGLAGLLALSGALAWRRRSYAADRFNQVTNGLLVDPDSPLATHVGKALSYMEHAYAPTGTALPHTAGSQRSQRTNAERIMSQPAVARKTSEVLSGVVREAGEEPSLTTRGVLAALARRMPQVQQYVRAQRKSS